jgi:sorbitol/mannitol transport system substrate-binding protein
VALSAQKTEKRVDLNRFKRFTQTPIGGRASPRFNPLLHPSIPHSNMKKFVATFLAVLLACLDVGAQQKTVTIATVNNPDMITLKRLSSKFEAANPEIKLNWVVTEENVLRQRVTTDVSTGSGQFDLVFLGLYEAPLFGGRGWLTEIKDTPPEYDNEDVFKSLRDGLSANGKQYAVPFNAESSILFYRKDLFDAKGLQMPEQPTYDDIKKFAKILTDKEKGVYGITLRGKPGWGENMAYVDTVANTFGAQWFDMNWKPTLDSPEWKKALTFYVDLLKNYGPPGASANGANETATIFMSGKAAMMIDATAWGGTIFDKTQSGVADKVAYANAPVAVTPNGSRWLWSWAFAIPKSAKSPEAAQKFALWATSKEYIKLVAEDKGWASVPPGTRKSTYESSEYQKAAPFAAISLHALETADPTKPTQNPVPYTGIQFVSIPEFQSFGSIVGQNIAGALSGRTTIDQALKANQAAVVRAVQSAGYGKKQ